MLNNYIKYLSLLVWLPLSGMWGQTNIVKPNYQGPLGYAVNTYTGGLFYQRQDLFIPSRGLDIDFTISYNSTTKSINRGMGKGWSCTYHMRYEDQSGNILIEKGDGRKDLYIRSGNNLISPIGVFDQLEEYMTGKYRLTMNDGMFYEFDDASHKGITKMEDRFGNAITFGYTSGRMTSMTGPAGRVVTLMYSGNNISEVKYTGMSLTRTYQYHK